MSHADFRLSLVVPVYNEEESIDAFISAIDANWPLKDRLEIVFVNDGSRDRTREVVEQAIARDPRVTLVNLARNWQGGGHDRRPASGQGRRHRPHGRGSARSPALILEFVKLWQTGDYDTVYGIRVDRSADTPMKRLTAGGFTASSTPSPPAPAAGERRRLPPHRSQGGRGLC